MNLRNYLMKCIEIAMPDGFMSAVKRNAENGEIMHNDKKQIPKGDFE